MQKRILNIIFPGGEYATNLIIFCQRRNTESRRQQLLRPIHIPHIDVRQSFCFDVGLRQRTAVRQRASTYGTVRHCTCKLYANYMQVSQQDG